MLKVLRRAVEVRKLETRKKKLEDQRDTMLAQLVGASGDHLYRHEYPNTPVLEDVFMELDYLDEMLANYASHAGAAYHGHATA